MTVVAVPPRWSFLQDQRFSAGAVGALSSRMVGKPVRLPMAEDTWA